MIAGIVALSFSGRESGRDSNLNSVATEKKIQTYLNAQKIEKKSVLDKKIEENKSETNSNLNSLNLKDEPKTPKTSAKSENTDINISELLSNLNLEENNNSNLKSENNNSNLKEISVFDVSTARKIDPASEPDQLTKAKASEKTTAKIPAKTAPKPEKSAYKNPKLAIIIDDVASEAQARSIKAFGLAITPSSMPPAPLHPRSAELANEFDFFMVHLPLAALHFSKNEPGTLAPTATKEQIEARVKEVKKAFPRVRYINNHTGSYFTSDYAASKALLEALANENIHFVDSLTTTRSAVPRASRDLGLVYVSRDVFIDNDQNVAKTLQALSLAVKKARQNGKAIAIGHPHKTTFAALGEAKKNGLFKGVQIVYLRDIYGLYN